MATGARRRQRHRDAKKPTAVNRSVVTVVLTPRTSRKRYRGLHGQYGCGYSARQSQYAVRHISDGGQRRDDVTNTGISHFTNRFTIRHRGNKKKKKKL